MDTPNDIRLYILNSALLFESLTSSLLATLLEVDNKNGSRTLGNKSSSLSFNSKVDLLIDIGALNGDSKGIFQTFMELRNQFMHNIEAKTYESCFKNMPGKETFVLKKYPQEHSLSKEQQLKLAVHTMTSDVLEKAGAVIDNAVLSKLKKKVEFEMAVKIKEGVFSFTKDYSEELNNYFIEEISKGSTFDVERLRNVTDAILGLQRKYFVKKINS